MATQERAETPTVGQARVPSWRVCGRCGHAWRSRSRGFRFRCCRCEALARSAALTAAQAIVERER